MCLSLRTARCIYRPLPIGRTGWSSTPVSGDGSRTFIPVPLVSIQFALSRFLSLPPISPQPVRPGRHAPAAARRCRSPQQQPATRCLARATFGSHAQLLCLPTADSTFQPSTGALAGWGTGRRPTTGQGLDLPSSSMDPLLKVLNCCRRGALLVASVVMHRI